MSTELLGSPCRIGKLTIKNRIVMEAIGNSLSELDGKVSPEEIAFYEARAKGGVGLIMSEAVSVDSVTGRANPRNMCIDDDSQIPGYKKLADAVHKYDCKFFVELYHPGRQGVSELNGSRPMFSASDIECKLVHQPVVSMTTDEIHYMIQKYVDGAVRTRKAGLDGVLVHGTHGYLINQFLSPYTNRRTDEYGGSDENRARFAIEIIKGIKEACGPDFPVGIRFSAHEFLDYEGLDPEEGITLDISKKYAGWFEKAGADLIDVSAGIYETMNTAWEPAGFDQGWKKFLAEEIKKVVDVPVVCTAVIRDPEYAERLLEDGVCDFIGSARSHLADPEWAGKALTGRSEDIRKCISCLNCMKGLMGEKMYCAINAQGGYELERSDIRKNGNHRKVAVIGAGPAGMEAARIAAIRGFDVTLFEKLDEPGGALVLASTPPHKEKIRWFTEYLKRQLEKLSVNIVLEKAPTADEIRELDPYAVFVAGGAKPLTVKSIPGITGDNVITAEKVLRDEPSVIKGKKVVVVGAGMTGLETAEYLAANGNEVSVYDMLPEVAAGEHFQNIIDIEHRIGDIPQNVNCKLVSIDAAGCVFENTETGEKIDAPCDIVVNAMGMKPDTELAGQFKNFDRVSVIGTNDKYSSIGPAVASGFLAAYNLD